MSHKKRQRAALARALQAAKRSDPLATTLDEVGVWYHPQLGVRIQLEQPRHTWSVGGLPVQPWTRAASLDIVRRTNGGYTIIPGQSLPRGYLWADPTKQFFGMGGPYLAYAPIERRCHACKSMYTWSASAQQHLYETLRVFVDKTATLCQPCARERRALEDARARYSASLAALDTDPTGDAHARVARDMLEILELGGRVSIDEAIGHCTRAKRRGAASAVLAVEAELRARRKP